jgi:hypothetical protein
VLAVLLNPGHANFDKPRLFEAEAKGKIKYDGQLKFGCQKMRLIKELALPKIPLVKRVELAIKLALKVSKDKAFVTWAKNWLNGTDRSAESAREIWNTICYNSPCNITENISYHATRAARFLATKKSGTRYLSKGNIYDAINAFSKASPKVNLIKTIKQLLK